MATTPLIRTPQVDGGTFYTFSSAARDLSKTLNNENTRLVFSKFALLNIPNFNKLSFTDFGTFENYMQFDTIDGMIWNGGLKADPNVNWTESLQNYTLNLEELILSDPDFDPDVKQSPAEKIFFKWLKETGALRFRNATNIEQAPGVTRPLFVEEDYSCTGTVHYEPVVKYLGEIDMVNNVEKAGEAYTELYINVPTEVGNTPTILFDPIQDANYQPSLAIQGSDEFIEGRNAATVHPQALSILAFYDVDNSITYTDPNANWMNQPQPTTTNDAYFTEPTTFTDASNVDIKKYPADYGSPAGFAGVAYRRNKLGGITLDWNPNDYAQITNDNTLSTIPQFNGSDLSGNFEFNAVLVYYDLIDVSDSSKTVTNLYGILLLDNITPTTDGGYIQRYPKYKPNKVTGQNGNSFGFKINLRFDASPGTTGIDTIVNDYNTFSMGLFSDATAQLQESSKIFQRQQLEISELDQKVQSLENVISSVSSVEFLQNQVNGLQEQINNASLAFSSGTTLLDLIAKNADEIQSLANGETSVQLQYNTSVVRAGSGIIVDTNVPNQITLSLGVQEYVFDAPKDGNGDAIDPLSPLNINVATPTVFFGLQPYTNMCRMNTTNQAGGDLIFKIDDSAIQFKTGQTIRLVFDTTLEIGSQKIKVYTDSLSRLNTGSYGILMAEIDDSELLSSTPIIEIICTDQATLSFVYDVIK
jgi:hypothetical protein